MEEYQNKSGDLIDTTDCLEAVGVFRGWKNFLFIIVLVCLLLLQLSFWAVSTGHVKGADQGESEPATVIPEQTAPAQGQPVVPVDEIAEDAKKVVAEPNQASEEKERLRQWRFSVKSCTLVWVVRFFNFVVVLAAALYCLTMLFILKVSLLGRLGGINHSARAFFISLLMFVLLLPWQVVFGEVVTGVMFTPKELVSSYEAVHAGEAVDKAFYYLRYTGYWLLVVLMLICSHIRSCRWARATLRRLEVI
jgi:hypothetical protein